MALRVFYYFDFLPVWAASETTAPMRYGWDGKRLIVCRPGTAPAHLRLLWLHRKLPFVAAIALLSTILIYRPESPSVELVLAALLLWGVLVGVHLWTRPLRVDLRILTVASVDADVSMAGQRLRVLFSECVEELREMDRDVRAGRIGPVEFERRWNDVYESLPAQGVDARVG